MDADRDADITGIAALRGPVRRRLYEFVAAQAEPVSRDAAADGVGVTRSLAAFHLDQLAAAGLLQVSYRRPPGRTGPGAGRPSKLYRRSPRELQVSLPPRHYDLAAELLAQAIALAHTTGQPPVDALIEIAHRHGAHLADRLRSGIRGRRSTPATRHALHHMLADHGYQPRPADGRLLLRNCPFQQLAQRHTELVCGMNLAVLQGLSQALPALRLTPRLDPGQGRCCVVFEPVVHANPT